MSWTSPRTWVTSEIVSAAIMNTHVRDNLLETAPAKAAAAGDIFYATGANAIARLPQSTNGQVLTLASGLPAWADSPAGAYIEKEADESVAASTTLQNDDDLLFPIGANEIWVAEYDLIVDGPTAGDIKVGWTVPSGATGGFFALGLNTTLVPFASLAGFGSTPQFGLPGTGPVPLAAYLSIYVANGATPGNAQLQWAQASANGTTTVKKGSRVYYREVP